MVLSILSPILIYRKFTQGRNFLPFLFSLKFLLLQSTLRQFLLPFCLFVCFSGAIFLPASPWQFLFFQVLHFPLLFLTFFFLPQEIPSTVLVIIFECNNDTPLYAHSKLIKYVAAISTNNYELAGKKGKILEDVFTHNKCMLIRLLWNALSERSKIHNRCVDETWGSEYPFCIFKSSFHTLSTNQSNQINKL